MDKQILRTISCSLILSISLLGCSLEPQKKTRQSQVTDSSQGQSNIEQGDNVNTGSNGSNCNIPIDVSYQQHIAPLLNQNCVSCHNSDYAPSGVKFDLTWSEQIAKENAALFNKALDSVLLNSMPPVNSLDQCSKELMAKWLGRDITTKIDPFELTCEETDKPGHTGLRRLTNVEYHNNIKELFGIEEDQSQLFLPDLERLEFTNAAEKLRITDFHIQDYLSAAKVISKKAVRKLFENAPINGDTVRIETEDKMHEGGARKEGGESRLNKTGTRTYWSQTFTKGRYRFTLRARPENAGDEYPKVDLIVGGQTLHNFEIDVANNNYKVASVEADIDIGTLEVSLVFTNNFNTNGDRNVYIDWLEITKLEQNMSAIDTSCVGKKLDQCLQTVVYDLIERAYNRVLSSEEKDEFASLAEIAMEKGHDLESAVSEIIRTVLISSHFLFRSEDSEFTSEQVKELNDFELAGRVSYFLWSQIPDKELFEIARNGKLKDEKVLREQISRMLKDDKISELARNFASEWMHMEHLDLVSREAGTFPDSLRASMKTESLLLFQTIASENMSLQKLATADFSFMNEELATHYGITGVNGTVFEKVNLKGTGRYGFLNHASFLTQTASAAQTSPVMRGHWVLENFLCEPPPPPPENVVEEELMVDFSNATKREITEIHSHSPACASCHIMMDPIGLGLEGFDNLGRLRSIDELGDRVDASGGFPDGSSFGNNAEMIELLGTNPKVSHCVSQKLMTYALGRSLTDKEQCKVKKMAESTREKKFPFEEIIFKLVTSDLFSKSEKAEEQ